MLRAGRGRTKKNRNQRESRTPLWRAGVFTMHFIDWSIVIALNGAVILLALRGSRGTKTSSDWFLANRQLTWWVIGLSLYATAIDSSDMVADSGGAYHFGLSMFAVNWVGVIVGWLLMSHRIGLTMYRTGMYTNAEYLEARFGASTRVISAVIQVLYRTVVMGIIGTTLYLVLSVVAEWSPRAAWSAVVGIAAVATIYTVLGGLKSVAMTDALQSCIMLVASLVLFVIVVGKVGGWSGIQERLQAQGEETATKMLHVGATQIDTLDVSMLTAPQLAARLKLGGVHDPQSNAVTTATPGWIVAFYFVLAGMAYSIVNHTQAMRMLGARNEWHLRMGVVLAAAIMIIVNVLNLSMGIMGRALYDLSGAEVDQVFPRIVRDFTGAGFRGLVVSGIVAASFSTYDSIGSTLSALITRDIYGRLFVHNGDDRHYLAVGRYLTPFIIFGSFAYVPFLLQEGMFQFYLKVVGAFVVPLMAVYLMGAFTRVHRRSATFGLAAGVAYGVAALTCGTVAERTGIAILVSPFSNPYAASPICLLVTAGTMVAVSWVLGWEVGDGLDTTTRDEASWLSRSRQQLQQQAPTEQEGGYDRLTTWLSLAVAAIGIVLSFVVFW